ncbi:MAG: PQQ-binding-like beta-propeller repeat protein [Verrucomicrobia bacterium]|nr:PQQ-binding-like beta-propeller repeat protein [Verrucomicrobiota bacterium]
MKQQRRGWMTGMCAMVMAFRVAGASPGTVDWPVYLGDAASSHYSRSEQIQAKNVARLQVAWTYRSGGSDAQNRSQIQCNPLVIDGVVYGTTPDLKLFALDATTGVQKWRFDPAACKGITKSGVNRGLVYWAEGSDRRILYANDHFLHAIDAVTGQRIPSFGQEGSIDLKQELGRDASRTRCFRPVPSGHDSWDRLQRPPHHGHAPGRRSCPGGSGSGPSLQHSHRKTGVAFQHHSPTGRGGP